MLLQLFFHYRLKRSGEGDDVDTSDPNCIRAPIDGDRYTEVRICRRDEEGDASFGVGNPVHGREVVEELFWQITNDLGGGGFGPVGRGDDILESSLPSRFEKELHHRGYVFEPRLVQVGFAGR